MNECKSLKGTKTEKNIVAAYLAESTAYTRYTYYAKQADKENFFPIGEAFRRTADNEFHHSKVFFKFLQGGEVAVNVTVDAGVIGTTEQNLEIAIREEAQEGVEMYQAAAKVADEEGFAYIAERFRAIAEVERLHRDRFAHLLKLLKSDSLWRRDEPVRWHCLVCGYESDGTEPPAKCPACNHPTQHYIEKC
jgi:rubrerythrin